MPALRKARSAGSTLSHCAGSETSKPVARSSTRTSVPSASSVAATAAPIPDAPPVTSALWNEDNFSHVLSLVDQAMCVRGLRERELRAYDRADRASRPELEQL